MPLGIIGFCVESSNTGVDGRDREDCAVLDIGSDFVGIGAGGGEATVGEAMVGPGELLRTERGRSLSGMKSLLKNSAPLHIRKGHISI